MGHHGGGHFGYGGRGGGLGGGFGWGGLLPGLILGQVLGEALGRGEAQPWPQAPQAPQTTPAPQAQADTACWNCGRSVIGGLTFCPYCGQRLDMPICRYCGQTLEPTATSCTHCGAPVRTGRGATAG